MNYKQALEKLNDGTISYAEVITEENIPEPEVSYVRAKDQQQQIQQQPFKQLPAIPDAENIKIPLTEKKIAYLVYPPDLKKKDVEILRKQLDLLELLAE